MPDQPRKIDLLVFRSDPEFPRSGDRLRDIRGMDQHLAGYASPVQARAAQRPFFHDSNFHPFCSSRGRDRQSGAAADDDEVEGAHRREARTRVYMLFDEIRVGVFSHKNFLSGVRPEWMVKLKNKKRLEWCLKRYANGGASQKDLAKMLDVTPRRFRQLYMYYTTRNSLPRIGQSLGRPKKLLDPLSKQLITETHGKYCLNAVYLEKVIFAENNIRLPHNTIHAVLKQEGLAKSEPNKQKRRKAYIRYEREHSLSAVHSDWHEPSGGPKVCAIEDDSSRKILSGGEFDEATTENTIHLMEEAIGKTHHLGTIRECITDPGTQYFANK